MPTKIDFEIALPASKSESNRALIIQALARWQSGASIVLHNLSDANDTIVLQGILSQLHANPAEIDAQDAGTAYRFLTAFLAVTGQKCVLTGTPRMQERPIGILVEALRTLGAEIEYVGKEGYPPLRLKGFQQKTHDLAIAADVSSQYASALLLVAPVLPEGLNLRLVGKISSKPYLDMTVQEMEHFGVKVEVDKIDQEYLVAPQTYQAVDFSVESDWSAASYWYSALALLTPRFCPSVTDLSRGRAEGKLSLLLKGLRQNSRQGDAVLTKLMTYWGVKTDFEEQGAVISHISPALPPHYRLDFTPFPDLAQTIIPLIAHYEPPLGPWQMRYPSPEVAWSVEYPAPTKARLAYAWRFVGLESLRIKETDRLAALQNELHKLGIVFKEFAEDETGETWHIKRTNLPVSSGTIRLETYHDHRMAMGFAPLQLKCPLAFSEPSVVRKSYPNFWEEWERFLAFMQDFTPENPKRRL